MADPRGKSSDLTAAEVVRLFNALSFAQYWFGPAAIMNCHVTITWELYGIKDHERAAALLGFFLNQARKWAQVGQTPTPRRRGPRCGEGFDLRYIYVHECSGQQGFHSHVLTALPRPAVAAFTAWTFSILRQLTGQVGTLKSVQVKAKFEDSERAMVDRCWHWFRYISKQCDERYVNLRKELKLWRHHQHLRVTCRKLSGSSRDIGVDAQRQTPFRSILRYGNLDHLYTGRELEAFRDCQREDYLQRFIFPTLTTKV